MSKHGSNLSKEALALPHEERIDLIERLLSSLDPPEGHTEALWARETEERIDAFEEGKIKTVTAEEFFRPPHPSSK